MINFNVTPKEKSRCEFLSGSKLVMTYTTLVCQKSPSEVQRLNIKVKRHLRNAGNAEQSSYSNFSGHIKDKRNVYMF